MSNPVPLVEQAIAHLKAARRLLVEANAPRAAEKARAAISSADGALRHAYRRQTVAPTPLFDEPEAANAAR